MIDDDVPLGFEPESHGGDHLPIGREDEIANRLDSEVDQAQHLPVSRIPDQKSILSAVRDDKLTVRRIDDVPDSRGLAEAYGAQSASPPQAARGRRSDRSVAAGMGPTA